MDENEFFDEYYMQNVCSRGPLIMRWPD